jgi:CheY-like chemotaxis protein
MPGMSGRQTVAQLRSAPCTARIPVVIMSGNETSLAAGSYANGFLQKPFKIDDLLDALKLAVEKGV